MADLSFAGTALALLKKESAADGGRMTALDYPPPVLPSGYTGPEAAQAMLLWAYGFLDQIQAYFDTYGYDEDRDADTIEQVRCLTDVAHIYRDWKRGVASDSDTAWRIRGIAAHFSE